MRIARFTLGEDPAYGVVEQEGDDLVVAQIGGDPIYQQIAFTGQRYPLDDVRLLSPVIPRSKVIGIGRNYADHANEMGNELPTEPLMFMVPNTAVSGPGDPVPMLATSSNIHYEGELAVVIGKMVRAVEPELALATVFGYTCANDVTARDLQRSDGQWSRAKGFDGSKPLGPWIETDLDPSNLRVQTRLDGETVQDGSTKDLIFDVATLISYVSQSFTLLPGDVILTGTPAGVGQVQEGQRVEVEVEGIGTLSNPFVRAR